MSSIGERLRKRKANEVDVFEYTGKEPVPKDVVSVRFHPSIVEMDDNDEPNLSNELVFSQCRKLKEVVFNEGLEKIGVLNFWGCQSLESIKLPSTLIELKDYAFQNCRNLREVVLNEGLRKIGDGVFHQCKSLESINIPSTVTRIGSRAFMHCDNLEEVVLNDGIKRIVQDAFFGCTSLERITIPSTVDEIGKHAFRGCTSLREVVIHNEKVQIDDKAFSGCTSLERFKFPSVSTRLNNIIQAGQRDIEAKLDDIHTVEWRDRELSIPAVRREVEQPWGRIVIAVNFDTEKLANVLTLISYHEIKEASTLFELALWKAKINQAESIVNRNDHRIEVPGPVKDTILQYLFSEVEDVDSDSESNSHMSGENEDEYGDNSDDSVPYL